MTSRPDEIIPTRASLLSRLRNWDDQQSWQRFFELYWKLIYSVARKAGLSDPEAQDVVQETIISVARHMPSFRYDPELGSFKAWLMQLTRWRIMDELRKKQYESGGKRRPREQTLGSAVIEMHAGTSDGQLEALWNEEWNQHMLETAISKVKKQVSAAQFQMFHLHVVKQMPAKDVAKRLKAKLAEVYFAKYKVGRLVQKQIKLLENNLT
jgi:RNA polymerase sigma factor (sigma-70 family)